MDINAEFIERTKINAIWNKKIATPATGDWIGIYPAGTYSNVKYLQYYSVPTDSDAGVTFDVPKEPGEYELRYFFTSSKHGTGYPFSGRSKGIVVPNDKIEVQLIHPSVLIRWQMFSKVHTPSDWIGLFDSSDDKTAKLLSKASLLSEKQTRGESDCVVAPYDHGVALIKISELSLLKPEDPLPEGSDKWELRLYVDSSTVPFLRAPFVKPNQ